MGRHHSRYTLSEIAVAVVKLVVNCQQVKTNSYSFLFFVLFVGVMFSCQPQDTLSLTFIEQQPAQKYSLQKIRFVDQKNGYAVGGEDYQYGVAQETNDGGLTWSLDTVSEKSINDFVVKEDTVFGAGFRGYYIIKTDGEPWNAGRPDDRDNINGLVKLPSKTIAVGGIAFTFGFVTLLDNERNIISKLDTPGEMNAIVETGSDGVVAVGYGQIYRSLDAGLTWSINDQEGDNYRDVFFINERVGWVVGQAGSILKTEDGGNTWETLRKPEVRNKLDFHAIHFLNEDIGLAVGAEGLVWQSSDGGANWSVVENLPEHDYQSVFIQEEVAWLVSEQGHILRLFL